MKSRSKASRIEDIEDRLEELEDSLTEDLPLYETPASAQQMFEAELEYWKEASSDRAFFKAFAKRNVDLEALAFYCLPKAAKYRLLN